MKTGKLLLALTATITLLGVSGCYYYSPPHAAVVAPGPSIVVPAPSVVVPVVPSYRYRHSPRYYYDDRRHHRRPYRHYR
jgi:hypothetical protein